MGKKNKKCERDDFPFPKYGVGSDIDNLLGFDKEEKAIEDGKTEVITEDMSYAVYKLIKIIHPPAPTEPTVEDVS